MIHKAQSQRDFERVVSLSLEKSGKINRYCTLGSVVMKETDLGKVFKISVAQFQIGSSYVNRKKRRKGEDFAPKRKSYYSDFNENGTVRFLNSNPDKKYICVWKSQIQSLEEHYLDCDGNILKKESISGLQEGEPDSPRYYHMENVWYVSANGQMIYGDEYNLYKDFISNV
jgi:hypothetical protein